MIIDTHTHISFSKKKKDFSQIKDELTKEMKENNIDSSFVIPDNESGTNCADMEKVRKLTKKEKNLFSIGTLKIEEVKEKINIIEKLFDNKEILGFKIFPGHDPVYPTDERWFPVYELCSKYDLPLFIHTGLSPNKGSEFSNPKYIVKLAEKKPDLKIIICHYFWPELEYCFSKTENFNNIYFDTSALADKEVIEKSGGIKKIREVLEKTIKRKEDSLIFGTDWPMTSVKDHIDLVMSLNISKEEKKKIFYKNTKKLFNLK